MTNTKWNGEWVYLENENAITPTLNGEVFEYWWDDMRPKEVRQLVERAYKAGYDQGFAEWKPHELSDRTTYVAELESELMGAKEEIKRLRKASMLVCWQCDNEFFPEDTIQLNGRVFCSEECARPYR